MSSDIPPPRPRLGSRDFTPREILSPLDPRAEYTRLYPARVHAGEEVEHPQDRLNRALISAHQENRKRFQEHGKRIGTLESDSEKTVDKLDDTGRIIVNNAVDNARFWRERALYAVLGLVLAVVSFVLGRVVH